MCEICLHSPCLSRCPNAPEPLAVYICSGCGKSITDGEDYVDLMGEQWCLNCIHDNTKVAEYDPY